MPGHVLEELYSAFVIHTCLVWILRLRLAMILTCDTRGVRNYFAMTFAMHARCIGCGRARANRYLPAECRIPGGRVFGASMRGRCTRNLEFARCNNRRALRDIPHVRGFIIRIGQTAAATVMAGVGLVNSLAAISRLIPSFRDASAFQKNYAYVRHL